MEDNRRSTRNPGEDEAFGALAAPILQSAPTAPGAPVGGGGGHIQTTTDYSSQLDGANSYMERLANKRDTESAGKMPRSAKAWESEQTRPGSWASGVGTLNTVGQGRSTPIGTARPLFQQRGS